MAKAYLTYLKTLPCCSCAAPSDDAHHLIGTGYGAMGSKQPDLFAIPMCRRCHDAVHAMGSRQEQYRWLYRTLRQAHQDGWVELVNPVYGGGS